MERERRMRYRGMEETFERRRQDMELRMQEAQLEAELRWMDKTRQDATMYQANMFEESTADLILNLSTKPPSTNHSDWA